MNYYHFNIFVNCVNNNCLYKKNIKINFIILFILVYLNTKFKINNSYFKNNIFYTTTLEMYVYLLIIKICI